MPHTLSDEIRYRLFHYLEEHPEASQRDLAEHLCVSVGKVNYCLRALIRKGWIKMQNFRNSNNKKAYAYYLTAKGMEEKANVTYAFLRVKMAEFDAARAEIERLTREVAANGGAPDAGEERA